LGFGRVWRIRVDLIGNPACIGLPKTAQFGRELAANLLRCDQRRAAERVLQNVWVAGDVAVPHIRADEQFGRFLVDEDETTFLEDRQIGP
jgi:hypothetical protein